MGNNLGNNTDELLRDIDNRLSRVEERIQDLSEIKSTLEAVRSNLSNLQIRVAGIGAGSAIIILLVEKLVLRG